MQTFKLNFLILMCVEQPIHYARFVLPRFHSPFLNFYCSSVFYFLVSTFTGKKGEMISIG